MSPGGFAGVRAPCRARTRGDWPQGRVGHLAQMGPRPKPGCNVREGDEKRATCPAADTNKLTDGHGRKKLITGKTDSSEIGGDGGAAVARLETTNSAICAAFSERLGSMILENALALGPRPDGVGVPGSLATKRANKRFLRRRVDA